MFRFRMRTLMLWVVIVALVATVIVQRESAVRREAALSMEQLQIPIDLMSVHRERLVDKRQDVLRLTQETGSGVEYEARLLRARQDLQIAEEAVVLSTRRIDEFVRVRRVDPRGRSAASKTKVGKNVNTSAVLVPLK
jgi:hypothetical protein